MGDITIELDLAPLEEAVRLLGVERSTPARARAVNKAAAPIRRDVLRRLSQETGLAQNVLGRGVEVRRAQVSAVRRTAQRGAIGSVAAVSATMTATGRDISVHRLRARQTRAGVSFKPGRKPTVRLPSAFIAIVNGAPGVFIRSDSFRAARVGEPRASNPRRRRVSKRGKDFPIARIVVPGVSRTLREATVQKAIQSEGRDILARRLLEEIRFELLKLTGQIPSRRRRRRNP